MVATPSWTKVWGRRMALVFAISAGIANVSTQLNLVITSLIYPPTGAFVLFKNTTSDVAVTIIQANTAGNKSYGTLNFPAVDGSDYALAKGEVNTTFEGGQIIYRNYNGVLYPYALTTPENMLYTCPPPIDPMNITNPLYAECPTALENEQLALVILSFVREAVTIGLFAYWCTKKQQWFRTLAGVVDNCAMGVLWYTACLTQAKYREALDQKKLPPPEYFERTTNYTDFATTIVSMIIASSTVHVFAVSGYKAPPAHTAQLVTGSLGLITILAQFFAFLKALYTSRKESQQKKQPQSISGKVSKFFSKA